MKLKTLHLLDFRGFRQFDIAFEPDVTVLVGVNGAGKTSLLDAMALALSGLHKGVKTGTANATSMHVSDIRNDASRGRIAMTAELAEADATWNLVHFRPGHTPEESDNLSGLWPAVTSAREAWERGTPALPLAVYFPTNRNALDIPDRIHASHAFDATSAYDGALDARKRNFRSFFEWFRDEEDIYNQQLARGETPDGSAVPAVREAIEALVPGATDIRIERRPQRLTLALKDTRLDVAQLSDGEKTLLALTGDLARRMVLAAPEAALAHPVVVLIDEVELHLHPGLQRTFLPSLRRVFPNAQLIVSTHSPQVLSSVHASNVRLIEDFQVRQLDRGTWQRDTNRILESVFGDPGRPPEVAMKLSALRAAVDADRQIEARRLIRELRGMVEGDDPDVFFLEQLLPPEETAEAHP